MASRLLLVQQHCPLVINNMNACLAHWLFGCFFRTSNIHLVLGLCVFSFLGKTAYCKNRIYGEKKSPKFLNIFCSPLMSIIREPFVFI